MELESGELRAAVRPVWGRTVSQARLVSTRGAQSRAGGSGPGVMSTGCLAHGFVGSACVWQPTSIAYLDDDVFPLSNCSETP